LLPLHAELVTLERRKQLLKESEEERLIRRARPIRKRSSLARRFVVAAGACMVWLGSKMQAYGTLSPVEHYKPVAWAVHNNGYRTAYMSKRYISPKRRVAAKGTQTNGSVTLWSRR
jgi:hypothetical protein